MGLSSAQTLGATGGLRGVADPPPPTLSPLIKKVWACYHVPPPVGASFLLAWTCPQVGLAGLMLLP